MPGTTLVLAGAAEAGAAEAGAAEAGAAEAGAGAAASADPRLPLSGFLAALAGRAAKSSAAGPSRAIDGPAGVWVIGGFTGPLTGRAARIEQARRRVADASEQFDQVGQDVEHHRRLLATARSRIAGANAAQQAERLRDEIGALRDALEQLAGQQAELEPGVREARQEHAGMLAAVQTRTQQAERLRADADAREDLQSRNVSARAALTAEQAAMKLDDRLTAFGGTVAEAQSHLLALPGEPEKRWSGEEWTAASCGELDAVVTMCFPRGTPGDEVPREIAELRGDARWHRGTAGQGEVFPALRRALRTYLAQTEQEDEYQRQRITRQRADRTADLEAARKGLGEAGRAAAAHRASVAEGIKAKLKKVAGQFDRLDQEYGGYGATLDFPEPEPPAEPDKPWRWTVTPKWRRAEGQRMSPYNLRGNTAQMDEKAVKLVCAAALAGGTDRPLLLVLDELGRNLGKQHRTEAVALFERIGRDRNITVIGALQDDMERYAIDASGLYVKLRRDSDASPYNSAPVVVGHDDNSARIALLHDWLAGHYPPVPDPEPELEDVS
jgi:hypothetical protein